MKKNEPLRINYLDYLNYINSAIYYYIIIVYDLFTLRRNPNNYLSSQPSVTVKNVEKPHDSWWLVTEVPSQNI